MDPLSDPRIRAFGDYVRKAHGLWHQFDRAFAAEIEAIDTDRRLANPEKEFNVEYLQEFRAKLGDILVIRSRQAAAKLRFQLHHSKGRAIKEAALNAVREILLDAVGGEACLTTCPIGPFAQHYLDEIQQARTWPPAGASPQEIHRHLSEVWKSIETAIGESDLIRREREDPASYVVEAFEARQRRERLTARLYPQKHPFSSSSTTARNSSKKRASGCGG